MTTLRTATLGCKVNQYETELVREALVSAGYRDAAPDEPAELCVVNTCTVTSEGDSKSRQVIRQMARRNPGTRIVVMGCYATRAPEDVAALPAVAEVITDKRELPDWLSRWGVSDVPTGISSFGRRQRAYVKVQDGCMLSCSFCIIPSVRPHLASRPVPHVVDEVARLVDAGHREIVLTGIHLGHYGVEWSRTRAKRDWTRLAHLLEALAQLPGEFRLRLSSIEATEVTRELIDIVAAHPRRICPHLHVSMQSGSDAVLRRMRRRWGARRLVDRCQLVQQRLDLPALTTDVIVGFPGESEDDFAATCRVCEELGFSKIHIFPFSPRRGTPAAEMSEQIASDVKAERCRRLAELEGELRAGYFERLRGRQLDVLIESTGEQPSRMLGTACRYAPVELAGTAADVGSLVAVEAGTVRDGRIQAI